MENIREKVDKVVSFASRHFGVDEMSIYGKCTNDRFSIVRYAIWYMLHYEQGISVGNIAKEFYRTKRGIFGAINKFKNLKLCQRIYKDMYAVFSEEYKNSRTK